MWGRHWGVLTLVAVLVWEERSSCGGGRVWEERSSCGVVTASKGGLDEAGTADGVRCPKTACVWVTP